MNNLKKFVAVITFIILICNWQITAWAQPKATKFRIIGYLRTPDIESGRANHIDFTKLTHINIAFINPDATGNFAAINGLREFVAKAHQNSVKVLASLGGGLAPEYYSLLLTDNYRSTLIDHIVTLVTAYNLDGADIDLEGERIGSNYEEFIIDLSIALTRQSKLLTAAVATVYKQRYTDSALAKFDFINIMSYDKTGPWRPANPGQHAPYDMAVSDLDYWANTRHIPKEKLSLGVPFYGYGFGAGAPQDMGFKGIINKYPSTETTDTISVADGGVIYYNGIPTIKAKTKLALQKAGGIMIWQLFQDAEGNNSLLKAINDVVSSEAK